MLVNKMPMSIGLISDFIHLFRFQTPRSENEERLIDSWADKVEPEDQISSLLEEEDDTNNALEDNPSDHLRPKDRIVLDSSKEILLLTNNTSEFQEVSKGIETVLSDPSPAYLPELERTDPLEPMLDPVTPTEDTTESENYDNSSSPSAKTTSDAIQTLSSTSVIPSGN